MAAFSLKRPGEDVKIEGLYFRGCPSLQPLRRMISEILWEEALDADLEFGKVRTEGKPES